MRAYQANRRAAIEDLIEADPVATRVREIMVDPQDVDGKCVRPSPRRGNNGHPLMPTRPRFSHGRLLQQNLQRGDSQCEIRARDQGSSLGVVLCSEK
jgi:hypothetical protein